MNREEIFTESTIRSLLRTARAIFTRHGLSPDDGEDLVQQMLLQLHQDEKLVQKIRSTAFFTTWIENRAKDMDRSKARRKFVELSEFTPSAPYTGRADQGIQEADLRKSLGPSLLRALRQLRGTRFRVMVLYLTRLISEGAEPPYREIADQLGTSITTVSRARDQLRDALQEEIEPIWQASGAKCRRYHRKQRDSHITKLAE